jgi:hypothetical protein
MFGEINSPRLCVPINVFSDYVILRFFSLLSISKSPIMHTNADIDKKQTIKPVCSRPSPGGNICHRNKLELRRRRNWRFQSWP